MRDFQTPAYEENNVVESDNNGSWVDTARRRSIIASGLIAVVTLYWVILLVYTNLPALALAAVAVVSLLLLSVAIAWAVTAVPGGESLVENE